MKGYFKRVSPIEGLPKLNIFLCTKSYPIRIQFHLVFSETCGVRDSKLLKSGPLRYYNVRTSKARQSHKRCLINLGSLINGTSFRDSKLLKLGPSRYCNMRACKARQSPKICCTDFSFSSSKQYLPT